MFKKHLGTSDAGPSDAHGICLLGQDPKHGDRPADNQRAETPAAPPIGTPRPPSLLKLIAQGSKGPAVKGDLTKAVRNLVREVTLIACVCVLIGSLGIVSVNCCSVSLCA